MSSSCSFRITRTAEDIAQTINSVSQRLIKLEQRLEAVEMQFEQLEQDPPVEQMKMLDGVDQIIRECQELLNESTNGLVDISNEESTNIQTDLSNEEWASSDQEDQLVA